MHNTSNDFINNFYFHHKFLMNILASVLLFFILFFLRASYDDMCLFLFLLSIKI